MVAVDPTVINPEISCLFALWLCVHLQYVQIDARALIGGKCRRKRVDITLEIKPAPPTAFECNSKCEPSGAWSGYGKGVCAKAR